jgi:adenylosuccinate synthase
MTRYAEDQDITIPDSRSGLQALGDLLDQRTNGRWVADLVSPSIAQLGDDELVVIDAVRTHDQIEYLRQAFGRRLVHVHLETPIAELASRYQRRAPTSAFRELSSYDEVRDNATEANVDSLHSDADISIDTSRNRPEDVEIRCAARLGLLPHPAIPFVDVLIGGEYGSEGKGNLAYYLAPEYQLLVRVGGPNAGHKVPLPNPYTHRQLPSGTMANDEASLLIGPGATLRVDLLLNEIADCGVEASRLAIDPRAMIVDDSDVEFEAPMKSDIGSTGQGGGAAAARRILGRRADIPVPVRLAGDIPELHPYTARRADEVLAEASNAGQRVLLEGTQGTGLSLYHGSYPHVTSRDTTIAGCLAEAGIAPRCVRRVVLVCRSYPIRVGGASGPMGTEIEWETIADRSGLAIDDVMGPEKGSVSGNQRRVAEFNWELLDWACRLNGPTDIALTFADYIDGTNRDARRFDQLSSQTVQFVEEIESVAGVPVSMIVTRFDVRSVIDRRHW